MSSRPTRPQSPAASRPEAASSGASLETASPPSSPSCAAGCTPACSPSPSSAGIVLVVLATPATVRTARRLHGHRGAAVRHLGGLPPRQLVARGRPAAQAARPLQHLPHHRRHLHAVRAALLPARPGPPAAARSSGAAPSAACCSGSSGSAPRAGSTCRSTSRSAGSRSSTSGRCCSSGGPAVGHPHRGRRRALHARRRRLRHQAAQPVTALVRVPRDLPRLHRRWPSSPHYVAASLAIVGYRPPASDLGRSAAALVARARLGARRRWSTPGRRAGRLAAVTADPSRSASPAASAVGDGRCCSR